MEIIHRLERAGFRFNVKLTYEYRKPDGTPPKESEALLLELAKRKPEAILYLAERNFRPEYIRLSEKHRWAIHKSKTMKEALDHALACINAMTGDILQFTEKEPRTDDQVLGNRNTDHDQDQQECTSLLSGGGEAGGSAVAVDGW